MNTALEELRRKGLYDASFEHDNCGIGAVVNINGEQSRYVVENALTIVEKLEHRAGKDASGETGDGVGILVQICHKFYKQAAQDLSKRAVGYDMESYVVNGNDFFSVYNGMSRLVKRARNGIGNACGFLECKTWRPYGHIVGDKQIYRNPELAKARFEADDCIKNFERRCIDSKWLAAEDFEQIQKNVDKMIEEAKQFAIDSPYPDASALMEDLYD